MAVTEIAPDLYCISTYVPEIDLQFCPFLSVDVGPLTESDATGRAGTTLIEYQAGPLANYMPYTKQTDDILRGRADLKPRTIAPMHGSAHAGDGGRSLRDLAEVMRDVLG